MTTNKSKKSTDIDTRITALYCRLSDEDIKKDGKGNRLEDESNSITNQELLCKGWFHPPNTYDCGSFVVN